ncbi:type II secretion system protein [Kiritimatiellota bacterium B12222]|nr:type II secretion system protein [Kiritimatiellota bacterium B12222]
MNVFFEKSILAPRQRGKQSRSAFTLIELLVVIAIIGILVGLLSAITTRSLDRSRRTACSSNMRTLVQGLLVYANDHDGYFPPTAQNSNSWPWEGDWAVRYSDFYVNYVPNKQVYFCPTDMKNTVKSEAFDCYPVFPGKASNAWRTNISYAYFFGYNQWDTPLPNLNNGRNGYANIMQVFAPSQSTMIADVMKLGSSLPSMDATPGRDWNHKESTYRKSGGHIGNADGHVRWISMQDGFPEDLVFKSGGRNYYIHQKPVEYVATP